MPLDVEDRVGDDLARSVVGDVATAVGRLNLDAALFVPLRWVEEIFRVEARAERHHRLVLEEKERVLAACLHLGDFVQLKLERVCVRDSAEGDDLQLL